MSTSAWVLSAKPRDWQTRAEEAWAGAGGRGIVSVVTGAGKTVFAEMCLARFHNSRPDALVLVLVPTIALLDQWYVSLREDLALEDSDVGLFSGEGRAKTWRPVNLMVLNTSRKLADNYPAERSMLIVDECHRAATSHNSAALLREYAATLGMSATPERDYDAGLDELLVPALGPVIFEYDYNQAVDDRVVAPFDLVNVEVDMLAKERAEYERLSRLLMRQLGRLRAGQDAEEAVRRLLQQRASVSARARLRVPVAVRLAEENRGSRTIVFHESIAAAGDLQRALSSRGLNATLYHSKISPVVRRDNLRLFRRGAFDVLVTCRALDEGVNVPETRVAIVASSTASTRQRIQRLGRVLRPAPGKTSATVFTLYATDPEHRRLTKEAEEMVGARSVTWRKAALAGSSV